MKKPDEYDEFGRHQWRGDHGVISQLQIYAGVHGWRSRKMIQQIITKMKTLTGKASLKHDEGMRERLRRPRKRKMNQSDVDLAAKMLRTNSGSQFATIAINNKIEIEGRGEKAKITRRTLERTFKDKYDAIVHRRQTKGTGSNNKESIWAIARTLLSKQILIQLGMKGEHQ